MAVGIRVTGDEVSTGIEGGNVTGDVPPAGWGRAHEFSEIRSEQQSHSISPQSMKRLMVGVQSKAGIVPVSSLAENDNTVRSVKVDREGGILPIRELL